MKTVKCTDNEGFEDQLHVGWIYPVLNNGVNGYQVVSDKGQQRYYGAINLKLIRVVLKGGPADGTTYCRSPLQEPSLIPRKTYKVIYSVLGGESRDLAYAYSHKIEGAEDYVYKAKE